MYGYSKQLFDVWAKRNGLLKKIVGLKYFNVFGPNEYHKGDMRSFVLKAFEQIYTSGSVRLFKSYNSKFKDGEQVRDFLYIKDAVVMTLMFLDKQHHDGNIQYRLGKSTDVERFGKGGFRGNGQKTEHRIYRYAGTIAKPVPVLH